MIIDAHQHFWTYDANRHDWIKDHMKVIRRDFLPADLEPVFNAHQIHGCVAVQADQTMEETQFLLELAKTHEWILGVVGWIDLKADDLPEQLERLSRHPALKGFRHIVQAEPDPMFLMRPEVLRGIKAIGREGYSYDILVFPHQLGAVLNLLEACPDQVFVIDHLAKPYIKDGWIKGWELMMHAIARYPNVYLKVSGLVTEASWAQWTKDDILPYLEVARDAFGPQRLMYGSDWPVCLLAASYGEVLSLAGELTQSWEKADSADFWYRNASNAYKLTET